MMIENTEELKLKARGFNAKRPLYKLPELSTWAWLPVNGIAVAQPDVWSGGLSTNLLSKVGRSTKGG